MLVGTIFVEIKNKKLRERGVRLQRNERGSFAEK
jgi:hypothetical protein